MMETNHSPSAKFENQSIPQRTQVRREHLLRYINLSGRGLEIGPYGYPTVFKTEANISYLDLKTRDQLVSECTTQEEIDSIPETDYLVTSNEYRQYVSDTFDFIIANHVLEHIPDLIQWFSNVSEMLNPDGILFLALPDKKYTFDKYRPNTKLSHILNDFYEQAQAISQEHLLEQIMYYDHRDLGEPLIVSERLDRAHIETVLSQGIQPWMVGYHCHVFQSETVLDTVFKPLIMMGYLELDLIDFVPAEETCYGEMMLVFKKVRSGLLDRPIDLPDFFVSDFQLVSRQADPGQPEPGRSDAEHLDKGKFEIIMSYIKHTKFAQKYIKPLYDKFWRASHR